MHGPETRARLPGMVRQLPHGCWVRGASCPAAPRGTGYRTSLRARDGRGGASGARVTARPTVKTPSPGLRAQGPWRAGAPRSPAASAPPFLLGRGLQLRRWRPGAESGSEPRSRAEPASPGREEARAEAGSRPPREAALTCQSLRGASRHSRRRLYPLTAGHGLRATSAGCSQRPHHARGDPARRRGGGRR